MSMKTVSSAGVAKWLRVGSLIALFTASELWANEQPDKVAKTSASAPNDTSVQKETAIQQETEESADDDVMDTSHKWVVRQLDSLSVNLDQFFVDMFFDDDISDHYSKKSEAKISYRVRYEEREETEYKLGIGVNIALPNTQERFNLLLESEDQRTDEAGIIEVTEEAKYSATLRFMIRESKRWTASIDAGIKWGLPPDPFTRLRVARPINLSERARLRFKQELSYYTQEGYGEETDLLFDYGLSESQAIRSRVNVSYLVNDEYFKTRYGLGWYKEVRENLSYALLGASKGNTENGFRITEYTLGASVRKRIYKDWMFIDAFPHILWASKNDWDAVPAFTFKLEAKFSE